MQLPPPNIFSSYAPVTNLATNQVSKINDKITGLIESVNLLEEKVSYTNKKVDLPEAEEFTEKTTTVFQTTEKTTISTTTTASTSSNIYIFGASMKFYQKLLSNSNSSQKFNFSSNPLKNLFNYGMAYDKQTDSIFICGGSIILTPSYNCYLFQNKKWSTFTLPTKFKNPLWMNVIALNGEFYLTEGLNSYNKLQKTAKQQLEQQSNVAYKFNTKYQKFFTVPKYSKSRYLDHCVNYQNQIVCAGGFSFNKNGEKYCMKNVEMYDPVKNLWTRLPDLKIETPWLKLAVSSDDQLYVVGKRYNEKGKISDRNRISKFDAETKSFQKPYKTKVCCTNSRPIIIPGKNGALTFIGASNRCSKNSKACKECKNIVNFMPESDKFEEQSSDISLKSTIPDVLVIPEDSNCNNAFQTLF